MVMGPCQNGSARRRANAVRNIAVIEQHALFRNPIEIGGLVDACAVTGNGLRGVVVRHHEDDIWAILSRHVG